MFSFNYPNYRDFSFLRLSACRADHIAVHEACNHTGHTLKEACTYCRGWPGLRELWAPPETRISRRSLRGAAWETEEEEEEERKSWHPSGNGSGWMKDIRYNEVKQSVRAWRWIFLSASLLLLQTWFWLWPAPPVRSSRGTYETRSSNTLHLPVTNLIDGAE